jgi:hypothetical protein
MLALTIDMDGPAEYAAIHGLADPDCDPTMMYAGPLERFATLCARINAPGTIFAIGRDLDAAAARLRELAERRFEVACHSYSHDYGMSRAAALYVAEDLRRARTAHERVLDAPPTGFRAPGHHLSPTLLDAVEAAGFAYSSSVLPSPPYYAVKALVVGGYRLLRRPSRAVIGRPRMAMAPRSPYRPGRDPYARGDRGLVELPVAVATRARLPVTGASLALAPAPVRQLLAQSLAAEPAVVLNLHAMDLVDPETDGLPRQLVARQPELRIPIGKRLTLLGRVLEQLAARHDPMTCAELAARV